MKQSDEKLLDVMADVIGREFLRMDGVELSEADYAQGDVRAGVAIVTITITINNSGEKVVGAPGFEPGAFSTQN